VESGHRWERFVGRDDRRIHTAAHEEAQAKSGGTCAATWRVMAKARSNARLAASPLTSVCPLLAHAAHKMAKLQLQRLLLGDRNGLAHDAASSEFHHDRSIARVEEFLQQGTLLLVPFRQPKDVTALRPVIQRDVRRLRPAGEHADLAQALRAHPARGEVGDAAVGEPQTCVGDVLAPTQDRDADGIHRHHWRVDERQNHIQIVDHQVEHHSDVRAPRRVGRQPVRLNEPRFRRHLLQPAETPG
jgi:hypothetical protein